ncbi:MAG: hypothetical protein ACI9QN_000960 [Arcticibacterium sp.]|jgi:hypothetical protein
MPLLNVLILVKPSKRVGSHSSGFLVVTETEASCRICDYTLKLFKQATLAPIQS